MTAVDVNAVAVAVVAVVDDDERPAFRVTEVDALGDVNKSATAKLTDFCVIIGSYTKRVPSLALSRIIFGKAGCS